MRNILILLLLVICTAAQAVEVPDGLPVIYIDTADSTGIVSREWRPGTHVRVCEATGKVNYECFDAAARAHGNSSFNKPKKPLTLEFSTPVSLLGMTANSKWFLVSNFMDHSLLRNSLALSAAAMTSLDWTPGWRLVNVVENGEYIGCYLAAEEIHVGKEWVDTDPKTGFLVELDAYEEAQPGYFQTGRAKLPAKVRYPENPSTERLDSIKAVFTRVENELYGGHNLDCIDLDSFVDYYIVYELCQNAEPNGPRSCYMFLGRGGRLNAGPVWDFDLAFEDMGLDSGGNIRPERFHLPDVRNLTVDSLYDSEALWYGQLLKEKSFRKRLSERWTYLKPGFLSLADSLSRWKETIEPSATADQEKWDSLDPAKFDNTGSFQASYENLRSTYLHRIDALDKLFSQHMEE